MELELMETMMQTLLSGRDRQKKANRPHKSKAQSLAEFAIALPILLLLLSGVVELGVALNVYLSLLDATREAARYYSNADPFNTDGSDNMAFYAETAALARSNLDPYLADPSYQGRRIVLDPAVDDVIVTVYGKSESGAIQYPTSGPYRMYNNQTSLFTPLKIESRFESGSPNAGILLVEVHYNFHQVMRLPWLSPFVPDPLLLRAYTIMPLAAAEPVQVTP
jgi:hypothetical protein